MKEHLKCNILSFDWPENKPTFYFTLNDIEGSHRIHSSKLSENILKAFPKVNPKETEYIYTTFDTPSTNGIPIQIAMFGQELSIYKQYLKNKVKRHFLNKGYVTDKNFVGDTQVWIPGKNNNNPHYQLHYKFSLKIQFAQVTEYPELVVSYDGTSKILKKSVAEIEDTTLIKKTIIGTKIYNYQIKIDTPEKEDFYNSINFNEAYPIFNLNLARALNIPLEAPSRENRYKRYLTILNAFKNRELITSEFKQIIPIYDDEFIDVPLNRINHIKQELGTLEYGNKNTGKVPKFDLPNFKPYRRPPNPNIKIFFIHHQSHQATIKLLYNHLKNGTGSNFIGIENFLNLKIEVASHHFIEYKNLSNPIPEIEEKLGTLTFDDNVQYAAFFISPVSKYTQDPEEKIIYYRVKELLLNENIVSQVIDHNDLHKNINKYQWHLNNISLALHAKLGGVPWKLAVTSQKELVIGVGAFTNRDENRRYIASAFSFQNNGLFSRFEYFTNNESKLLAGSICNAIRNFTSVAEADKVVIHFYKEMRYEELQPIIQGMNALNLNVPLYILNINKTDSEDIFAYDLNWDGNLMPKSGTYIRIGYNKYLLFNNARYDSNNKYPASEGYHFPIKINISSPDKNALEDNEVILKLLTQVYQFSRLYWKSMRQQNVPVTIKYPEMLAQIAPRFNATPNDTSNNKLWFL
ncbi:Piwi domain-containing protein [Lutibacter sp.]|uniref:Piwi domain-containing protein n=1 Tax=Lutibacter sp. TaxID=1925666 RepID=UPI0027372BD8|nr:Piwi domain-containing protein [Lutibacter sp.]MDP3314075.1 Piwi domain-containing protein [Lutibacter sp.]